MTAEQIYKSNKRKSKIFKTLSPVVYWVFIILTVIFFVLAVKNSIGNVIEILDGLDKDVYTEEQIVQNYNKFVQKYGEWNLIGNGTAGLSIRYINIKNALFSGFMVTYTILTVSFLIAAIILGKILFPGFAKLYSTNNEEMVDMATLKSAAQIDNIVEKEKKKEWF